MITAAAVCPAPPLLAREVTGAEPVLPEMRQACSDAVAALLDVAAAMIVVVGVADQTRSWPEGARLDLGPYAPGADRFAGGEVVFGAVADCDAPSLPLSVGLGALLLDEAGYSGPRIFQSVAEDEPTDRCAALGASLASAADQVALLVMADGSARRGLKAPGYLDERSFPFDADVERAVLSGDLAALLGLDAGVARELMATGRASLQVLAGALGGTASAAQIRYRDDPFGVAYLVASLTIQERGN